MKKLIAVLAAFAGALGLHAANIGTSFEGLLPEGVASTNYVDVFGASGAEIEAGKTPGDYWDVSAAVFDEEGFVVKNYAGETKPTDDQRSDYYSTHANTNYLAITTKAGNPVTRYINAEDAGSHAAVSVLSDGSYYFDSSVKFTAFETNKEASVVLGGDGKLAIWLLATDEREDGSYATTNLIVSAGRLSDSEGWVTTPTNYVCELRNPEGVDVTDGGWHRVSVKTFGSVYGNDIVPGFSIAIDSKLVRFKGDKGDAGIVDNAYLAARVKNLYNTRTLFPSAQLTGDTTAISSVSFDGVGSVDDLVFTDTNPNIDDWNESGSVTIDAGDYVTGYTYTIQGDSPVAASGAVNLQYSAVEGKTITISDVVCAAGYVPGGVTTNGVDVLEGWTVSDIFDMETITVVAKLAGATVSGADTGNGSYETAAEVFAAIGNGDITPSGSDPITVTLAQNASEGVFLDADGVSVTLDLAGKTIEGVDDIYSAATIYLAAGNLTITNSTVDIGRVDPLDPDTYYAVVVESDTGSLAIGGGFYDGAVEASAAAAFTITDGSFLASAVETFGTIEAMDAAVKAALGNDYGLAQEGDYYVVQSSIVSYDVTFVDPAGVDTVFSRNEGYVLQVADIPSLAGKVGYDSTGWATNGVTVEPVGIVVTEALTFTAVYTGKSFTIVTYTNGVENTSTNFTYDSETASAIVPAISYNSSTEEWDGEFYESDGMTPFSFDVYGELTQYAYATVTEKSSPVTPIPTDTGSATYDDAAAASAAADTINGNKSTYIEVPAEANVVDRETYNTYVAAVADGVNVTIEFTAAGEAVASNKAETAVMLLPVANVAAAASGTVNATITASQPGFYYSIMTNAQPTAFSSECEYGERKVGNGSSITLPVPKLGTKGFYKVKVSPRKVQ